MGKAGYIFENGEREERYLITGGAVLGEIPTVCIMVKVS